MWERLRAAGLRIGVLSNTIWSRAYHRDLFRRDGVLDLIDADVYSSEIHVVKPHPAAFEAVCAALGVPPKRCVYVGDRLYEDVYGPQQVGMRTIWIPHSRLPSDQQVQVDAEPDAVVHELREIVDVLAGWQRGG